MDKAVVVTLLARLWAIIGGLGTLFFVTDNLSPELQGYYYTFNSLIALQVFAELGLNYAIIQFSSHEIANLKWASDGTLFGDEQAKRRLQSILRFGISWFGFAAILIMLTLMPAGFLFFSVTSTQANEAQTNVAWCMTVFFSATALMINTGLSIIEGCNKIIATSSIRFAQSLCSILSIWASLFLGADLYSLAIGSCVMAVVGAIGIIGRYRRLFYDLWHFKSNLPGINWRKEILPFQWRIAISWISGYLIFQMFTPLLFATWGPIAAGQMGMSMQIISAINGMVIIWFSTKAPTFGMHIAQGCGGKLNALFIDVMKQSIFAFAAIVLILSIAYCWGTFQFSAFLVRLLPVNDFALLVAAALCNHIVAAEAIYLRAHKNEPLLMVSIFTALTILVCAIVLVPSLGARGAVIAFCIGSIGVGFLGGNFIFLKIFRENFR